MEEGSVRLHWSTTFVLLYSAYVDALYHVTHTFMYKCPAPQVIEIEVK